jgi:4-hydroxy-tetrahydrodipicolinate synthase
MKKPNMKWQGVIPAMTTAFKPDLSVDHAFIGKHARWMVDHGCTGIVALGSLGESATLRFEEKVDILKTLVAAVGSPKALGLWRNAPLSTGAERLRRSSKAAIRAAVPKPTAFRPAPVVAGIASLSTAEAVELARAAEAVGCSGLMVLPPYVYSSDWREMKAHVQAVIRATKLSCMLYNNPVSYETDFLPEQIKELAAAHPNLHAVKESSADVRRVTALKAICGDRLALFVGVDDLIVEGLRAGAVGWIAGLVNAFPRESVALFNYVSSGTGFSPVCLVSGSNGRDARATIAAKKADGLYRWFLPLLRMDTVPKFVQLIKLVQQEVGMGSERVRAPRCVLAGAERKAALETLKRALAKRPKV